MAVQLTVVFE